MKKKNRRSLKSQKGAPTLILLTLTNNDFKVSELHL